MNDTDKKPMTAELTDAFSIICRNFGMVSELEKASIEYWLQTGRINAGFKLLLERIMEEYAQLFLAKKEGEMQMKVNYYEDKLESNQRSIDNLYSENLQLKESHEIEMGVYMEQIICDFLSQGCPNTKKESWLTWVNKQIPKIKSTIRHVHIFGDKKYISLCGKKTYDNPIEMFTENNKQSNCETCLSIFRSRQKGDKA